MNPKLFLAVGVVVLSYYLYSTTKINVEGLNTTQRVLLGLQKHSLSQTKCPRVAIGYNANLDLIVNALEVLEKLNIKPGNAETHSQITSIADLQETFSFYMGTGSAAERVVSTAELFNKITDAADSLEKKQYHTGGNAALMANSLASRGCPILLGGAVGSTLASLLHPDVLVTKDTEKPQVNDEVHLIMEYAKGAEWGNLKSPRANRFIITRDETNAKIAPLEAFHKSLPEFDPTYVILSGLHLLETLPVEERTSRLDVMLAHLQQVPRITKSGTDRVMTHLELASIGDASLLLVLASRVVPRVDSLGLNEQELGGIYAVTGGKEYGLNDFKAPKVHTVVAAIKHIFTLSTKNGETTNDDESSVKSRSLTRVHFHCLHFHLIAQKKGSVWVEGNTSVAQGALACSSQACEHTGVDLLLDDPVVWDKETSIPIHYDNPIQMWSSGDLDFYLSPVLVCRTPTRTVGLGDAISGVGLTNHKTTRP